MRLLLSLLLGLCWVSLAQSFKPLSIDRLYSLPWLWGTPPQQVVWSTDSQRIAFLWNEEGGNFRDVWMAETTDAVPRRLTTLPRLSQPAEPGRDIAKLQQLAAAEVESGVSEVVWRLGSRSIAFHVHGQLYTAALGEPPMLVAGAPSGISGLQSFAVRDAVAFLADGDLWTVQFQGRHAQPLRVTHLARPEVAVEQFFLSPDGSHAAVIESDTSRMPVREIPDYLSDEPRLVKIKRPFPGDPSELRRLGVVSLTGGGIRWIDLGPDRQDLLFGVKWSPDNSQLLVDKSDLYSKRRQLLLANPATGETTMLTTDADAKNVTDEWWVDWSQDGRSIYFVSDRDNDYHLYRLKLSDQSVQRMTSGDWAVFTAVLPPGSSSLFFTSNKGKSEERHVYRLALTDGSVERLTRQPGTHVGTVSPNGQMLADIFSDDVTPPDLFLQSLQKGAEPVRATHSPLPEFAQHRWVAARYVTFRNVHDGTLLHARLTLPAGFDPARRYPAILGSVYSNTVRNQWGGRIAHPTAALDQYLAQQGYVLLNVDIAGSSGHGKVFRQRIAMDYGGIDVDDLFSAAEYLKGTGYVDPERIGMWGSSYGGLLTTTSLFTHPGVFKAGVAGAPATSLFHALTGEMRTMMAPRNHQSEYKRASAFLKSGGLRDHLLLLHGMRDQIVLFQDSVTLQQRLILQGGDAQLQPLPDAPHSWDTGPSAQTRFAYHRLIEFFKTYLGEGPSN